MKTSKLFILCLLTLLVYSCSNDSEDDLNIDNPIDNPIVVNYTDNIKTIMQSSCVGCHSSPPSNGAPFALVNFSQVNQRANGVLNAMKKQSGASGAMPPSGRLPQATIDLIQQWIDNGKPEN